jgi:hypothetical protein
MRTRGLKWIFLLLLFGGVRMDLYAQDSLFNRKYKVVFNQIGIDSAIHLLENQTHLHFTYNAAFTDSVRKVTAQFDSVPLSVILDSLFQNPFLDYKIVQSQLVVVDQREEKILKEDYRQESILRIAGKVVDARTGKPLAYSSVSLKGKGLGVITNNEGNFVLHIPPALSSDTLQISHLGYFLETMPLQAQGTFRRIGLHEKVISLPEILIRTTNARKLLVKALRNIAVNYDRKAYRMRVFYRETVKQNKTYQSYSEALLEIYKRALHPGLFGDQISLLKNRKYTNHAVGDSLSLKLKGGLAAILQLDIIRNRPSFMKYNRLDDYQFQIQNMTLLDGRLVYVVGFQPQRESSNPQFDGELYIDAENFAIVRVHFSYPKKSLKTLKNRFIVKRSRLIQSYPVKVEYTVGYQKTDSTYYIKHILGTLVFKTKNRKLHKNYIQKVSFEMIRTDINSMAAIPIKAANRLKVNGIFADMLPGYDIGYWGNANIILPESTINKALQSFSKDTKLK